CLPEERVAAVGIGDPPAAGGVRCYHLAEGTSEEPAPTAAAVSQALSRTELPALLVFEAQQASP
ncbi:MAG TPA: hypothetical protein VFX49_01645, partial [Chloroflexota bacterium]|nr:hypothetical protein [Chloroflexota bacterium]